MNKTKKILAMLLVLCLVLSTVVPAFADGVEAKRIKDDSDIRAQKVERIENAKKTSVKDRTANLGLAEDELVRAIVIFEDAALSDEYSAEEIRADKAADAKARLTDAHDAFFKSLPFEAKRLFDYTALLNGMAVSTEYKNVEALEKLDGVKAVYLANTYGAPEVEKEPMQENASSMMWADYVRDAYDYNGEGMLVAVLDTGLNYTHEAFQDYGILAEELALTKEEAEVAETTVAGKYISDKIPWSYDYYLGDDDVMDYNGHGSHVSGSIAGYVEEADGAVSFSGVAPAAQLVFMKIFDDVDSSTSSDIYFAALEDCYILGVDAFNMSIGSDNGFTYDLELENALFGNLYEKLDEAGIVACISAGNNASMGQAALNYASYMMGMEWVKASYADYGTVGSPSTYEGNLSIASVENTAYPALAMMYGETVVEYIDSCEDGEHGWFDTFAGQTLEFVDCGLGADQELVDLYYETEGTVLELDFTEEKIAEVTGKIALIQRGTISFEEKVEAAAKAGAVGVIVYNHTAGESISMLIETFEVPAVTIGYEDGEEMIAGEDKTIFVSEEMATIENPNAWQMSQFSGYGVAPDLTVKPQLTAPGGMIYSAVAGDSDAYEVYSGTSMAAPNATGAFTLLLQALKDRYPEMDKYDRSQLAEDLMLSTAGWLVDADGYPYMVRRQGAGVIDVDYATAASAYFVEPIVNTKDDPEKTGVYTYSFEIKNLLNSSVEYNVEPIFFADYPMDASSAFGAEEGAYVYNTLTTDYLYEAAVEAPATVLVPANGSAKFDVTVTLSEGEKAYFDEMFPNGNFIDGYVNLWTESRDEVSFMTGDVNGDGTVNAADAATLLRSLVSTEELTDEQTVMADVDADGEVDSQDAALLMRYSVGGDAELAEIVLVEELYSHAIHATTMSFYGDWTQAPTLDEYTWMDVIDADYFLNTTEVDADGNTYADYGYTYLDVLEMNVGFFEAYALNFETMNAYAYLGDNLVSYVPYDPAHNAITTQLSNTEYWFTDFMLSYPTQLRNVEHMLMTVVDAETGEIYLVDDTQYLPKASYDATVGYYLQFGSFYWDGINYNEASENYGEFVPSGTKVQIIYQSQLAYPGASLEHEITIPLTVDYTAPWIEVVDFDGETITFKVCDNHSIADISIYDQDNNTYLAGAPEYDEEGVAAVTLSFPIELATTIMIDVLDYASNYPTFVLSVDDDGNPVFVDVFAVEGEEPGPQVTYDSLNDVRAALEANNDLEEEVTLRGTVIYKDGKNVYIQTLYEDLDDENDEYYALCLYLDTAEEAEALTLGDVLSVTGTTDMYYGIPELKNVTINEVLYDDQGNWDEIWYVNASVSDLVDSYRNLICSLVWVDAEITSATENSDGTVTYELTDGTNTVKYYKGIAGGAVGDMVSGFFIVSSYNDVPQLRTFEESYVEFATAA